MKYYEEGAVPLTFEQMRVAYLKYGLVVEEMPLRYSASPVKIVWDGVPYTLDCYHDIDGISTNAAKFYITVERHHADIKRVYEIWRQWFPEEMTVGVGGGLQLQAFFTAERRYQGILSLSLIDDGRFEKLEAHLRALQLPFERYVVDPTKLGRPLVLSVPTRWFQDLPDIENVRIRHETGPYRPSTQTPVED